MAISKVFIGVIWASIQRFGTMIISFVTNIVLARLLLPEDFGTIGMLLLFLAIANTFVDSGFGSALIQKKDATIVDSSTVFYINLLLSFGVYAILFISAPWIAKFYNVDILCPLLRVQGLILILNAFSIVQTAILRKRMDFSKLSISNLLGNLIGSVIGIGAAVMGYGVWSLVIRTLVVGFATTFMLWIIGKWKPLFTFSIQSFKELFSFGGFMLLSSVVYSISNNIQTLVIGKIFKPADLGVYTQARQLRNIATESVSSVISQVMYPEFANNQTDNKVLSHKLNLSVSLISFLAVGLMALCVVMAKPLILLLYGEKWANSIVLFQILCLAGCFTVLQDININIIAAIGKSKVLFYLNIIKLILFIVLLLIGAKLYGLIGLVFGNALYALIAYLAFSLLSTHYLKESPWNQYKRLLSPFLTSIISALIVGCLNFFLLANCHNMIIVVIDTVVFSIIYLILSIIVNNEGVNYLKNIIQNTHKSK